jgi:ribosome biogenesis GTPase
MDKSWTGCDIEAEFFGEERKRGKQERKIKEAKDRSKFKKTDRDKWQAQVKSEQARMLDQDLLKGRVLSINPQQITVDSDGKVYACSLRGLLKKEFSQDKNLVAVGDFVRFKPISEKEGFILAVDERYAFLARADNLSRRKAQLIAANIDLVLITLSVVLPPLKPFLADRYIIAARKGGMHPVIVINKIDLLNQPAPGIEAEKALFEEFRKGFLSAGIPVIAVSAATGEGIDALKKMMQDKASVFSGQSGVGKSSLINTIAGLNLTVGDPVEKTRKGSHTTTTAQLIPLPWGGFCIDTPGIRSFGVWQLKREEIETYFDDIHILGTGCKFPDCRHFQETHCAVKCAVEEGTLSLLRYESYISLLETIEKEHLRR